MGRFILVAVLGGVSYAQADMVLVHVGGDEYRRITTLDDIPLGTTTVIRVADGPGGPSPGPKPPAGEVTKQVEAITKKYITKRLEAQGLLAVIRALDSDDVTPGKIKEGLTKAVEVLASNEGIFPGNKFNDWLKEVLALTATHDRAFIKQVSEGVTNVNLTASKSAQMLLEAARGDVASAKAADMLELGGILELILTIIKLLKDLGIIGGAAQAQASLGWSHAVAAAFVAMSRRA